MKKSESITLLASLALAGFIGNKVHAQNIYVSNQGTPGSISEFDPSGNPVTSFSSGLNDPQGLAFDSNGNLYVANYYGDTVAEFNSSGTLVNAAFASGLTDPEGLAFDGSGNLYVANAPGRVSEFDSHGNLINASFAVLNNPPLKLIGGLTFDRSGNLYAACQTTGTVWKFDSSGNLISASFATSPGAFDPAFDKNGNLYVSNYTSNSAGTVSEFDSNGNLINASFASGLTGTSGLAFDSSGNLFVVNRNDNNILEFDPNGHLINTISSPSLNSPIFIAIQPVPEPSTWALVLTGVAAFLGMRRRK